MASLALFDDTAPQRPTVSGADMSRRRTCPVSYVQADGGFEWRIHWMRTPRELLEDVARALGRRPSEIAIRLSGSPGALDVTAPTAPTDAPPLAIIADGLTLPEAHVALSDLNRGHAARN